MSTEKSRTDKVEAAADWSDFRANYGIPGGIDIATAHHLFVAGWVAYRDGDTRGPLR